MIIIDNYNRKNRNITYFIMNIKDIKEKLYHEAQKSTVTRKIACAIIYKNNVYLGHNRVTRHNSNKCQCPLRGL